MNKNRKGRIIGRISQIPFVLGIIILIYFGDLIFFIISLLFFICGGLFEWAIMNHFFSEPTKKLSKKDKISTKIKNAVLWVHTNIIFKRRYNLTIYDYDKLGYLIGVFSYLIMFLYILIAFMIYKRFSYYAFAIYLIPIISNTYSLFRNYYFIVQPERSK